MNQQAPNLPRVVVIGAGFGGLRVAKQLVRQPVDVTLVDQNNYHTFQPLLYQVATAALEPEGIVYPVRAIFRAPNIHFRLARVKRVDLAAKEVSTDTGSIPYDYLVLAAGSVTNFFGNQEIERHAFGLKDLYEAEALRSHLLTMFERASVTTDAKEHQTLLTFVIVGGGPTGVEMAGSLTELIHQNLVRDYPRLDVQSARVILLEAADSLLGAFPPKLRENALDQLRRKGVEVRLGAMVAGADENEVRLKDGTSIPTHTLFWAAGVRAADLAAELGQPTARGGRVKVTPTLHLEAAPSVFVIGDMAYLEQGGQPLPQVAPVAIQMGEQTAANILRHLRGEAMQPFHYKDPGSMATIGRSAAVAQVAGLQFTGFTAWVIWLFIHLIQLIGFRNRLIVLVNWAWNYVLADRGVRLITTPPPASQVDQREQVGG